MLLRVRRSALRGSGTLWRARCLATASGPSPEYLRDVVANARQPDAELTSTAIQDLLAAGRAAHLVDLAKEAARGERERGDSAADGGRLSVVLLEAAAEAGDVEAQFLLGSHFALQLSKEKDEEALPARVDGAGGPEDGSDEPLPVEEAAAKRKKVLGEIRRTLRVRCLPSGRIGARLGGNIARGLTLAGRALPTLPTSATGKRSAPAAQTPARPPSGLQRRLARPPSSRLSAG